MAERTHCRKKLGAPKRNYRIPSCCLLGAGISRPLRAAAGLAPLAHCRWPARPPGDGGAARSISPPARPLPFHSAPSTRRRLVSPARSPLAGERSPPACAAFRLTPPLAATRLPPLLHAATEPRPCAPPQPSPVCAPPLPSPASAPPQLRRPARRRCPHQPARRSSHWPCARRRSREISHSQRSAPLAARARERRSWRGGVDGSEWWSYGSVGLLGGCWVGWV